MLFPLDVVPVLLYGLWLPFACPRCTGAGLGRPGGFGWVPSFVDAEGFRCVVFTDRRVEFGLDNDPPDGLDLLLAFEVPNPLAFTPGPRILIIREYKPAACGDDWIFTQHKR